MIAGQRTWQGHVDTWEAARSSHGQKWRRCRRNRAQQAAHQEREQERQQAERAARERQRQRTQRERNRTRQQKRRQLPTGYLTSREAVARLGMTRQGLAHLAERGRICTTKATNQRTVGYRAEDGEQWAARGKAMSEPRA